MPLKALWTALSSQRSGRFIRCTHRRSASTAPLTEYYDIVCVGGGPAGLSLLNGLRNSPVASKLKLALVDSQQLDNGRDYNAAADQYSKRCSSLTPTSADFLTRVGAWDRLDLSRVQPYHEMQVWDGISGAYISFEWQQNMNTNLANRPDTIAYMIENQNLVLGLYDRLIEQGGVTVFPADGVQSIDFGHTTAAADFSAWPVLRLKSGQTFAARLLVGADGFNSPVRSFADIPSRGWDYDRHGVVATLNLDHSVPSSFAHKVAYQRFLPTGPIAMLPLPGPFATLVWSTTPERAKVLKGLSPEDFVAMVNAGFRLSSVDVDYLHTMPSGQQDEVDWREQHTKYDLDRVPGQVVKLQEGSIASFPLRMRHADTYVGERVALVGDAAHSMHPLAGQGLNTGIADVESLLGVIESAVAHGQDIGSPFALENYNSARYATNHALIGFVDKLHKLYSFKSQPLVALRSWGLSTINSLTPVKEFFMKRAAGA